MDLDEEVIRLYEKYIFILLIVFDVLCILLNLLFNIVVLLNVIVEKIIRI